MAIRVVVPLASFAVAAAVALAGCGGDDLGPDAAAGHEIAKSSGCVSCHGPSGEGGTGPAWTGLFGSTVELEDGSSVVADEDYLRRAIVDPDADAVPGFAIDMPANGLDEEQVDLVIAYIKELQ